MAIVSARRMAEPPAVIVGALPPVKLTIGMADRAAFKVTESNEAGDADDCPRATLEGESGTPDRSMVFKPPTR